MAKITDPDSLTYIVNGSPASEHLRIDTTAKTIRLVASGALVAADGVSGQCLFSKIKEVIKASSLLISVPLPIREMIYDESMELINGWTFFDTTTVKMIRDCGVAYVNASGVTTAMFACFTSLGTVAAGTSVSTDIYYVQDSASSATPAYFTHLQTGASTGVNELVQIYSDPNGDGSVADGYDRRSYAKVFLRRQGYTYDEANNTEVGYPTLTYKKYNFPLTHAVDANITVNDATVDAYTGMALTWYAAAQSRSLGTNGPYNFHVIGNVNGKTHLESYAWIQRQLRRNADIDAGAGNRIGLVTPALAFMDGSTLKTRLQAEGGVHLDNLSATSYNNIAEADDTGAYRTYPLSVSVLAEFDTFLDNDADAYFWIFRTSDYGTPGATPLLDASSAEMKGAANVPSASFAFNYATDIPLTGVALGKSGAKIAIATTTLTSTGAKLVFVAGLERWYANP